MSDTNSMKELIMNNKRIINEKLYNEENGLHIAATCNYVELAILLIQNDIDINKKDVFGRTPLMISCEKGHIKIVEVLLTKKNIDINIQDKEGNTAAILGKEQNKINNI